MSLDIHVSQRESAIVVALSGTPNADMLLTLRDALSESLVDAETLVVDIGGLTEVQPQSLDLLLLGLADAPGRIRIAAGRWSGDLPFSDALTQVVPVYPTVRDAVGAGRGVGATVFREAG